MTLAVLFLFAVIAYLGLIVVVAKLNDRNLKRVREQIDALHAGGDITWEFWERDPSTGPLTLPEVPADHAQVKAAMDEEIAALKRDHGPIVGLG